MITWTNRINNNEPYFNTQYSGWRLPVQSCPDCPVGIVCTCNLRRSCNAEEWTSPHRNLPTADTFFWWPERGQGIPLYCFIFKVAPVRRELFAREMTPWPESTWPDTCKVWAGEIGNFAPASGIITPAWDQLLSRVISRRWMNQIEFRVFR